MKQLLASLLLVLSLPVMAQIYTYTDAQGNAVFTNNPPEGVVAKTVNLPPTNTAEVPAASNYVAPPPINPAAPSPPPASQQQSTGGGYAEQDDNANYDGDAYDQRNPAVAPERVGIPPVDPIVPIPVHTEASGTRR